MHVFRLTELFPLLQAASCRTTKASGHGDCTPSGHG